MAIIHDYKLILCLFTLTVLQLTSANHNENLKHEKPSTDTEAEGVASPVNSTDYKKLLLKTLNDINKNGESLLDRDNVELLERKSDVLEEKINKICERLRSIDVLLTKFSQDPPSEGGSDVMKLLHTYNQACLDLLFLCSIDKLKALDLAQDILESGGPKFFDIQIGKKMMQERFKWDDEKLDAMEKAMQNTYKHWNELWTTNNNFI